MMSKEQITHDQRVALEMNLRNALCGFKEHEWFTLEQLIYTMYGDQTHYRIFEHDPIVRSTLLKWNWHCSAPGRADAHFVRINYSSSPKIIQFAKGGMLGTRASWPPYEDQTKKSSVDARNHPKSHALRKKLKPRRGPLVSAHNHG